LKTPAKYTVGIRYISRSRGFTMDRIDLGASIIYQGRPTGKSKGYAI